MDKRKAALLAIILLAIAGFFLFDLGQYLNLANLKAQQAALSAQVSANPLLVGGLFFLLYVVVTALSLPGAALMTLVAGALFGLLGGTLLVSFASTLGATLAMLISRFLLRDWVQAKFSQRLAGIDQGIGVSVLPDQPGHGPDQAAGAHLLVGQPARHVARHLGVRECRA